MNEEIDVLAARAGLEAARKILDDLGLTIDERCAALYAAAYATDMAKATIALEIKDGRKIRADLTVSAAFACALAAMSARDEKIKEVTSK